MRIAIYSRVSTSHQVEHQTIEQQLDRLTAHVQMHAAEGWVLDPTHIFRDEGYSGAVLARPGLDRLRDAVKGHEIDRVLVTTPDRLARNYVHQMVLLEEWARADCLVAFLDRPMSDDPHDHLLLQIRGAVAEYERTLIAERMRRGRLAKLRAGLLLALDISTLRLSPGPGPAARPSRRHDRPCRGRHCCRVVCLVPRARDLADAAGPASRPAWRTDAFGPATLVEPDNPRDSAQSDLHGTDLCAAHALSCPDAPALGDARHRPPARYGHPSARRGMAACRTGARPRQPSAFRRGASQAGEQSRLCAAEQYGAPVLVARTGELRVLRPGLHGACGQWAELLLFMQWQGTGHVLASGDALRCALYPRQAAR